MTRGLRKPLGPSPNLVSHHLLLAVIDLVLATEHGHGGPHAGRQVVSPPVLEDGLSLSEELEASLAVEVAWNMQRLQDANNELRRGTRTYQRQRKKPWSQ